MVVMRASAIESSSVSSFTSTIKFKWTMLMSLWCCCCIIGGGVSGFVNVASVTRPTLQQSTSTSNTYEPSHLLMDAFQRNPFADEAEDVTIAAATVSTKETETSKATPSSAVALDQEIMSVTEVSDSTGSMALSAPWFSQIANNLGQGITIGATTTSTNSNGRSWLASRYIQAELTRRRLKKDLRIQLHHFIRDSGLLRSIMDFLATIGAPSLAMDRPEIIPRFLQLAQNCIHIPYGTHHMQGIDMYLPDTKGQPRGLVFFVHGGAWGSGFPKLYALAASPFLEQGMAVAVVGYRTFPDGDIHDQVFDLEQAAEELTKRYPNLCLPESSSDLGVSVVGHSSGAHIAMQMLVNRLLTRQSLGGTSKNSEQMRIDSFIGMSAPYEIASHYEFETLRGLEELSPMKAACGYDKERLSEYSPVLRLFRTTIMRTREEQQRINRSCPRIAMIHGDNDDTVPFTSSREAAKLLSLSGINKCQEMYLSETGHSDTVLELMFGGKTRDAVMDWLLAGQAEDSMKISKG